MSGVGWLLSIIIIKEKELSVMPKASHYNELVQQLESAISNEPLMEALDERLMNESKPTDYPDFPVRVTMNPVLSRKH